jgi:Sulfatase-modifying factor enzyme 1
MANTWQGNFPLQNLNEDGFPRTSPVTAFPPNGYGVYDMIGNVWEWTADWYSAKHEADAPKACCIPENPRGGSEAASYDTCQPNIQIPRKVIKGGSHLCAPNYCRRYRPAARHAQPIDTSAGHVGFRCVVREAKRLDGSVERCHQITLSNEGTCHEIAHCQAAWIRRSCADRDIFAPSVGTNSFGGCNGRREPAGSEARRLQGNDR